MPQMNISINGHAYAVACNPGEEERLQALADVVDQKVRMLAAQLGQIGDNKLLLMASLLLADELTDGSSGSENAPAIALLESAAARIEDIAARLDHP